MFCMFPQSNFDEKSVQLNRGSFLKNPYFSCIVKWFYQTELRGTTFISYPEAAKIIADCE